MNTLLAILAHSGANSALVRHWPGWIRTGCDIMGVGREDTITQWPVEPRGPKPYLFMSARMGKEGYVEGDLHLRRFLNVLELCLAATNLQNRGYEGFLILEYDCLFTGSKLPELKPGHLNTVLAGHCSPGFMGQHYYHCPWWFDRETAEKILRWGRVMLLSELTEHGFIDRFIGLMADLYSLPINPLNAFTRNTLDSPEHIAAARTAIASGACFVHGCKSQSQFEALTK